MPEVCTPLHLNVLKHANLFGKEVFFCLVKHSVFLLLYRNEASGLDIEKFEHSVAGVYGLLRYSPATLAFFYQTKRVWGGKTPCRYFDYIVIAQSGLTIGITQAATLFSVTLGVLSVAL